MMGSARETQTLSSVLPRPAVAGPWERCDRDRPGVLVTEAPRIRS